MSHHLSIVDKFDAFDASYSFLRIAGSLQTWCRLHDRLNPGLSCGSMSDITICCFHPEKPESCFDALGFLGVRISR